MSDRAEFGDIEENRKPTTIPRTVSVTRAQEQEIARLRKQIAELEAHIKNQGSLGTMCGRLGTSCPHVTELFS